MSARPISSVTVAVMLIFVIHASGGTPAPPKPEGPRPETSGDVWISYDGSNHRTATWEAGASVTRSLEDHWTVELGGRTYTDMRHSLPLRDEAQGFLNLHRTLWKSPEGKWFFGVDLDLSGPSVLSGQGLDLSPDLEVDGDITDKLSAGISIGSTLSTSPDQGDKAGFLFTSAWFSYDTEWLHNESDSVSINFYFATNETRGYGNSFSVEASYGFDVNDSLSVEFGIGTEIATPYERHPVYATGRLSWHW